MKVETCYHERNSSLSTTHATCPGGNVDAKKQLCNVVSSQLVLPWRSFEYQAGSPSWNHAPISLPATAPHFLLGPNWSTAKLKLVRLFCGRQQPHRVHLVEPKWHVFRQRTGPTGSFNYTVYTEDPKPWYSTFAAQVCTCLGTWTLFKRQKWSWNMEARHSMPSLGLSLGVKMRDSHVLCSTSHARSELWIVEWSFKQSHNFDGLRTLLPHMECITKKLELVLRAADPRLRLWDL